MNQKCWAQWIRAVGSLNQSCWAQRIRAVCSMNQRCWAQWIRAVDSVNQRCWAQQIWAVRLNESEMLGSMNKSCWAQWIRPVGLNKSELLGSMNQSCWAQGMTIPLVSNPFYAKASPFSNTLNPSFLRLLFVHACHLQCGWAIAIRSSHRWRCSCHPWWCRWRCMSCWTLCSDTTPVHC